MSESRRKKRGAQQDVPDVATKTDRAVAKYLLDKCPKKQTLFMNQKVYYFIGSKAVDVLLQSKWTKASKKEPAIFTTRDQCVDYLNRLRNMELFMRAQKITVKKVESKKDKKKDDKDEKEEETSKGKKKEKVEEKGNDKSEGDKALRKRKTGKDKGTDKDEKPESEGDPESPKVDAKGEKKKKKIRLELHEDQRFLDNSDAYVWIYEPTSIKNIILGTIIVLGAIGVCLFPLWPPIVRQGVYYLSLGAIGLIGLLIAVSLLRYVVFAIVWGATFGRLRFWFLPNLTEDCGFFESFKPLYNLTRRGEEERSGDDKDKDSKAKKKASKKSKDSDDNKDSDKDKEAGDANKEESDPDRSAESGKEQGESEREEVAAAS